MKKFLLSAGMVAIGTAVIPSAQAESSGLISPSAWTIGASLRGFYDDNYAIASSNKKGSLGFSLHPEASIHLPLRQTDFGLRYHYGIYYYEQRDSLGMQAYDQTHQVDFWLDHAFNTRWKLNVSDYLALGQEPELLAKSVSSGWIPVRVSGDNLANHLSAKLDTEWTRLFSTSLSYNNDFYIFENRGATVVSTPFPSVSASRAGILDRMEQSAALNLQWQVLPETMAFVGYSYAWVNYTGDEPISFAPQMLTVRPDGCYRSADRDSRTHYGYIGVRQEFTPNLMATVRGGASYTDNYADPLFPTTSTAPYADANITYTYIPGSYVQLGFTHDINATDVVRPDLVTGRLTQHQQSSVVYADINHRFTQKLSGTVVGRWQMSEFNGGAQNIGADQSYSVGVSLRYQFTRHFSADAGCNFDFLGSDYGGRDFTRGRYYIGIGASY